MIELDEPDVFYARCTCLDRARVALEASGQHHCASVVGRLQIQFNELADAYNKTAEIGILWNPSKPCVMLDCILADFDETQG